MKCPHCENGVINWETYDNGGPTMCDDCIRDMEAEVERMDAECAAYWANAPLWRKVLREIEGIINRTKNAWRYREVCRGKIQLPSDLMIMQIARQHDGSTEGNTVNIIHAPGTRQFNIDSAALTTFLQKARFAREYIDDLNIILLPYASFDEADDEDWDKYGTTFVDVWLYCEGATADTLNRQLLIGLRRACYEEDQQDSTDECLANWGINPRTITDEEIETDIVAFADWYDDAQFVSVREVNRFCHTLYFRTRRRAELAQMAFAKLPLQSVVTAVNEFHAVQVPTIGIMRQSHIDEILRAMHPVQSSFNVTMP